jgi:hypothetical protein
MGLFKRSAIDPQAWQRALHGTFDEFAAIYDSAHVNTNQLGRSPLLLALANTDPDRACRYCQPAPRRRRTRRHRSPPPCADRADPPRPHVGGAAPCPAH